MQYPNFQGQSLLSHVCVFLLQALLRPTSCRVKQICVRIREVTDDNQFTDGDWNSIFIERVLYLFTPVKYFMSSGCHTLQSWFPVLSSSFVHCGSTVWFKPAGERNCPGRRHCPGSESGFWRALGWRSLLLPQRRVLTETWHSQKQGTCIVEPPGLAGQHGSSIEAVLTRKHLKLFSSPVLVRRLLGNISNSHIFYTYKMEILLFLGRLW